MIVNVHMVMTKATHKSSENREKTIKYYRISRKINEEEIFTIFKVALIYLAKIICFPWFNFPTVRTVKISTCFYQIHDSFYITDYTWTCLKQWKKNFRVGFTKFFTPLKFIFQLLRSPNCVYMISLGDFEHWEFEPCI